jgi:hypothetical protein
MDQFVVVFALRFGAGGIPARRRMLTTVPHDGWFPKLSTSISGTGCTKKPTLLTTGWAYPFGSPDESARATAS